MIIHIILYAKIRGRRTNLNYNSVRQEPGLAYKSKLHKNTHPVTVVLKETYCSRTQARWSYGVFAETQ